MRPNIPQLPPVDPWPTRKLPQERFDTAVQTSMNQMSAMVAALNDGCIPTLNGVADDTNRVLEQLPTIVDAANQAASAKASAKASAESATAAEAAKTAAESARDEAEAARDEAQAIVGPVVPPTRKITAGPGLKGGGTLEQDIVLEVDGDVGGSVVMAAPTLEGRPLVAIGYANTFRATAVPGLLRTRVARFVVIAAGGEPFEAEATDNACEFEVRVPDDTPEGVIYSIEVYAVDNLGNRSQSSTLSPTASVSAVVQPTILSPADGAEVGSTTAEIVLSSFSNVGTPDEQAAAQYQVLTAQGDVVYDSGEVTDAAGFASHTICLGDDVDLSGAFAIRARQKGAILGWAEWSTPVSVTITRDYVVAVDNYGKLAFSTDGVNFESPLLNQRADIDDYVGHMLEANGKIILWHESRNYFFVSEDGFNWTKAPLPFNCRGVIKHGSGFLAHDDESFSLSEDGLSWGSANSISNANSNTVIINIIYIEETGRYIVIIHSKPSASWLSTLYTCTSLVDKSTFTKVAEVDTNFSYPIYISSVHTKKMLFQWGDKGVLCFMPKSYDSSLSGFKVDQLYSTDGGLTFSSPVDIPSMSRLIQLGSPYITDNVLIYPCVTTDGNIAKFYCMASLTSLGSTLGIDTDNISINAIPIKKAEDDSSVTYFNGSRSWKITFPTAQIETFMMEKTDTIKSWHLSNPLVFYEYSYVAKKYIVGAGNDTFYSEPTDLLCPLDYRLVDEEFTMGSTVSQNPSDGRGNTLITSHHTKNVYYHTINGKFFEKIADEPSWSFPRGNDMRRCSVKVGDKYVYLDIHPYPDVWESESPYSNGINMLGTVTGGSDFLDSKSALIFTGVYFIVTSFIPSEVPKYIATSDISNKSWTLKNFPNIADVRGNVIIDSDGQGKIVAVGNKTGSGYATSADHGNTWSAPVDCASVIGFVPVKVQYVDGVWLASSGMEGALSKDTLTWSKFTLTHNAGPYWAVKAKDGRILLPCHKNIIALIDPDTAEVEMKSVGIGSGSWTFLSTY